MGCSSNEGKDWIRKKLSFVKDVRTVLDVGPGAGLYNNLLHDLWPKALWIGVEIWPPYITQYKLKDRYHILINADIRKLATIEGLDVVIFGDVLEHMTREEARYLYSRFLPATRYIVINIPIAFNPQGPVNGNENETHVVPDWTHEQVLATFPGITTSFRGKKKGCYIARGKR